MPLPYNIMNLIAEVPVDTGYDDDEDYPFENGDEEDDSLDEDEW